MNNEPVAWMHHCLKSGTGYLSYTKPPPLDDYKPIPLYIHPVKELTETSYETLFDGEKYTTKLVEPKVKELTDEEIIILWNDLVERTILRKAQE